MLRLLSSAVKFLIGITALTIGAVILLGAWLIVVFLAMRGVLA